MNPLELIAGRYGRLPESDSPSIPRTTGHLTADERMGLEIIRGLGQEAFERLLLCGRYQWVWDSLAGRK